jgi:hypothetical protein
MREWKYISCILNLSTGWTASCPCRFTAEEAAPGTHCIGSWVDPRASPDIMEKRKIPFPCQESNHDYSGVQPVA